MSTQKGATTVPVTPVTRPSATVPVKVRLSTQNTDPVLSSEDKGPYLTSITSYSYHLTEKPKADFALILPFLVSSGHRFTST